MEEKDQKLEVNTTEVETRFVSRNFNCEDIEEIDNENLHKKQR